MNTALLGTVEWFPTCPTFINSSFSILPAFLPACHRFILFFNDRCCGLMLQDYICIRAIWQLPLFPSQQVIICLDIQTWHWGCLRLCLSGMMNFIFMREGQARQHGSRRVICWDLGPQQWWWIFQEMWWHKDPNPINFNYTNRLRWVQIQEPVRTAFLFLIKLFTVFLTQFWNLFHRRFFCTRFTLWRKRPVWCDVLITICYTDGRWLDS